jgi:hypothetical protein
MFRDRMEVVVGAQAIRYHGGGCSSNRRKERSGHDRRRDKHATCPIDVFLARFSESTATALSDTASSDYPISRDLDRLVHLVDMVDAFGMVIDSVQVDKLVAAIVDRGGDDDQGVAVDTGNRRRRWFKTRLADRHGPEE